MVRSLANEQIVGHVSLDVLALVAERDHELVEAEVAVVHHDVPQDRPAADLDHRLGLDTVSSDSREPTPPARMPTFIVRSAAIGLGAASGSRVSPSAHPAMTFFRASLIPGW